MDQQQYLAMSEIMADCREFASKMYLKMAGAGILISGHYHLKLDIGREKIGENIRNAIVELESSPLAENWYEDRMTQENLSLKGWVIKNDPFTKSGIAPFHICPYIKPLCGKPE